MQVHNVETVNNGNVVNDMKWDIYGQRLALASSDTTVRIVDVGAYSALKPVATLKGHPAPVLCVSWAHPSFGPILASCCIEGSVIIWKEVDENVWVKDPAFHQPKSSVSSISWAPHELGLRLACGSSDGSIHVFTGRPDGCWDTSIIVSAHSGGVATVSWGPSVARGPVFGSWVFDPIPKLASGGCDSTMRMWRLQKGSWYSDIIPVIREQSNFTIIQPVKVELPMSTTVSPSVEVEGLGRSSRNTFWSVEDDELLLSVWLNTSSKDSNGKHLGFWRRVAKRFEENRKGQGARRWKPLKSRWGRIHLSVNKFINCYNQASKECQGRETTEREIIRKARKLYRFQNEGRSFILEHAWMQLKDEPKWKAWNTNKPCISSDTEACDQANLNIETPLKSEVKSRKPEGARITLTTGEKAIPEAREVNLSFKPMKKYTEVEKADAMEDLVQNKLMEIDMRIIYKDTSSMTEEELQIHVPLREKLKLKYRL